MRAQRRTQSRGRNTTRHAIYFGLPSERHTDRIVGEMLKLIVAARMNHDKQAG
jgi:hypothetical protein